MATGGAEMAKLGRDLKVAANKDLRKELLRSGRQLGPPVKAEIHSSALVLLPKRGGLAGLIAGAKVRVSTRLTPGKVGVRFIGKWSGHDLEGIDEGLVRHPVRGNRKAWVEQKIPAGYWSKVFKGPGAQLARKAWLDAIDAMIRTLRARG